MNFNVKAALDISEGCSKAVGFYRLIESDPFGTLAFYDSRHLVDLDVTFHLSWYSDYQHRMVLLIGILVVVNRFIGPANSAPTQEALDCLLHCLGQVTKFARDVIHSSHPKEADVITQDYLPNLLKDLGVTLSDLGGSDRGCHELFETRMLSGGVCVKGVNNGKVKLFPQ